MKLAKLARSAWVALNLRRKDRIYHWYVYHHL
jgi:hypothetical protein